MYVAIKKARTHVKRVANFDIQDANCYLLSTKPVEEIGAPGGTYHDFMALFTAA